MDVRSRGGGDDMGMRVGSARLGPSNRRDEYQVKTISSTL
jgi:hypothetical protein